MRDDQMLNILQGFDSVEKKTLNESFVVECPPDIADGIGGWCSSGVGQKYGSGHKLSLKLKYLVQII